MGDVSASNIKSEELRIIKALEPKGIVNPVQTPAVKICCVITAGVASWHGAFRRSVSEGAKWICPPFQSPKAVELEQDTHMTYVELEQSAFQASLAEVSSHRLSLLARENLHDSSLDELVMLLSRESRNGYPSGPLFKQSLQTALSSYLIRKYPAEAAPSCSHKGGLSMKNLRCCLDYIEEHFSDGISLDDLVREIGVSRSHLIRSFRQSTGASPYQYLIQRRVEHAKAFMSSKHYTLTDVALACGFANQHHLSRVFRTVVGSTPSEYRSCHC